MALPEAQIAEQRPTPPPPPVDPHGAVLCIWTIYIHLKTIGDRCFPDDASEFPELLNEAIERMDKFIMDNGPATRAEIDESKAKSRAYIANDRSICTRSESHPLLGMYEAMQSGTRYLPPETVREAFRESITKLLAIPRKPVLNPCF
jgi:hypothetical protein